MKILHINSYYILNEVHSELTEKLDEQGVVQHLFIPVQAASDKGKNRLLLNNAHYHYEHCFGPMDRKVWPLKMLNIWRRFKKVFGTIEKPDLIHAHTLIVNGWIAYWAWKKWEIPYVVTVRNTDVNVFLKRIAWLRKPAFRIMQEASAVIVLSPAYRDIHLKEIFNKSNYDKLKSKVQLIPSGINDFWFKNRNEHKEKQAITTILFVGRLDKNKNLLKLVEACEILEQKNIRIMLNVAGQGPELESIKGNSWSTNIVFHGHVYEKEKLQELYNESDMLVVPSYRETFGLIYPEAMSQGLPVIYSRNQGFDSFFDDGEIGYAVNPASAEDIADRIQEIMENLELMSKRASQHSGQFKWDNVIEDLLRVYQNAKNE